MTELPGKDIDRYIERLNAAFSAYKAIGASIELFPDLHNAILEFQKASVLMYKIKGFLSWMPISQLSQDDRQERGILFFNNQLIEDENEHPQLFYFDTEKDQWASVIREPGKISKKYSDLSEFTHFCNIPALLSEEARDEVQEIAETIKEELPEIC